MDGADVYNNVHRGMIQIQGVRGARGTLDNRTRGVRQHGNQSNTRKNLKRVNMEGYYPPLDLD